MLSRDTQQQQLPSPFTVEGLGQSRQVQPQEQQPPQPPESNRGRGFRRSGNAMEVAAGASFNSAIIFLFHLLQVHPLGFVVALAGSHFYFVATAFGEGRDRAIGNVMTGASAGVAGIAALSDPIGELWEARQSQDSGTQQVQALYSPQSATGWSSDYMLILIGVIGVALLAVGSRENNRGRRR